MDVTRYTFQSPYPNQIQIGRPDPSVKQDESKSGDNPAVGKAQNFSLKTNEAVQPKEVKPTVKSEQLLDTYA